MIFYLSVLNNQGFECGPLNEGSGVLRFFFCSNSKSNCEINKAILLSSLSDTNTLIEGNAEYLGCILQAASNLVGEKKKVKKNSEMEKPETNLRKKISRYKVPIRR